MNLMPSPSEFRIDRPAETASASGEVEQAIIGRMLVRPDLISDVASKVRATDFTVAIHASMFDAVVALTAEGRSPSIETLSAMFGLDEVAPGLTMRAYLKNLARDAVVGAFLPMQDAIEALREYSHRRQLTTIGETIAQWSAAGRPVAEIAADAVAGLDDVVAFAKDGRRLSYDAAGAADAAIAHMDSTDAAYPTMGLADLDRITGGWPRGQLSVLAGRPGMGKSAAGASAMRKAAARGHASMFFSLEMTKQQMGARLLADMAFTASSPIHYEDILNRRIDDRGRQRLSDARKALMGLPLVIQEERGITLAEIAARSRKHAAALDRDGRRLDVIFVDHIGLVRASNRYAGNRVREVAEISDGLATLAKELDASVVALCQLNRGVEGRDNKRPSLADLRDSGAIEEDASTVTFVYRPAYYLESRREDDPSKDIERQRQLDAVRNVLEFVVAKNRNGRVGIVQAFCDIGANAIRDAAYTR